MQLTWRRQSHPAYKRSMLLFIIMCFIIPCYVYNPKAHYVTRSVDSHSVCMKLWYAINNAKDNQRTVDCVYTDTNFQSTKSKNQAWNWHEPPHCDCNTEMASSICSLSLWLAEGVCHYSLYCEGLKRQLALAMIHHTIESVFPLRQRVVLLSASATREDKMRANIQRM